MTYASSYALGDLVAQAGSQVRGNCLVSLGASTVSLPVVITHGSAPGPVLAITAGIHGGEYVPMVAVRQFVRDLDPALMRGTIVACLQSSPVAFQQRTAFVNPLDGKNLNRSFPGDPHGGPTARLAAWLRENLIARADFYIDCHCGDLPEALEPFAGVSPGSDGVLDERARAMADCFDVPRLIVDRLAGSTIRAAALAGIPAVLIEVGGEGPLVAGGNRRPAKRPAPGCGTGGHPAGRRTRPATPAPLRGRSRRAQRAFRPLVPRGSARSVGGRRGNPPWPSRGPVGGRRARDPGAGGRRPHLRTEQPGRSRGQSSGGYSAAAASHVTLSWNWRLRWTGG